MNSLNRVQLIGYVGSIDQNLGKTANNSVYLNISIATTEKWLDDNGELKSVTEWHHCVLWDKYAHRAFKVLKKGSLVYVEGKLNNRQFTDKSNVVHKSYDIVINDFLCLSSNVKTEAKNNDDYELALLNGMKPQQ